MARTKTQKALLKAERSGTWCAERNRRQNDHYGAISQHVRVTPSKQQKLNKVKHKERIFTDGAPFACLEKIKAKFTLCKLLKRKDEIKGISTLDWVVQAQKGRIKGINTLDWAVKAQKDRIKGKNTLDWAVQAQKGRIKGKNTLDWAVQTQKD